MNKFHQKILKEIKKKEPKKKGKFNLGKYLGTPNYCYSLSTSDKVEIVKNWAKNNEDIKLSHFVDLLNSLYKGKSYDEKTVASILLIHCSNLRSQIKPKLLDNWLNNLNGWAEIDSLCQMAFTADEMFINWNGWKKLITKFSKSKNISKRRASLVLLTYPIAHSNDQRLTKLAFEVIDRLKREKDILITKAISWLLRSFARNNEIKQLVVDYLNKNEDQLPKIAVRETRKKLATGKKN